MLLKRSSIHTWGVKKELCFSSFFCFMIQIASIKMKCAILTRILAASDLCSLLLVLLFLQWDKPLLIKQTSHAIALILWEVFGSSLQRGWESNHTLWQSAFSSVRLCSWCGVFILVCSVFCKKPQCKRKAGPGGSLLCLWVLSGQMCALAFSMEFGTSAVLLSVGAALWGLLGVLWALLWSQHPPQQELVTVLVWLQRRHNHGLDWQHVLGIALLCRSADRGSGREHMVFLKYL